MLFEQVPHWCGMMSRVGRFGKASAAPCERGAHRRPQRHSLEPTHTSLWADPRISLTNPSARIFGVARQAANALLRLPCDFPGRPFRAIFVQ